MKIFEAPEIEIIRFSVRDILTSSDVRDDEFPISPVSEDGFPITDV